MDKRKFDRYRVIAFAADGMVLNITEIPRDQRTAGFSYKMRAVKRDMRSPMPSGQAARVVVEKVQRGR